MMDDSQNLLSIENLTISFKNEDRINKVIKNIDLHLRRGEITGLVGESGSGKSVTGLAIMGLLPARQVQISGSICFSEKDKNKAVELTSLSESGLRQLRGRKIAMIFQEPMSSLNPVLTCGYQVDEVAQTHLGYSRQQAKKHTLELFNKVALPTPERIYDSYPHQISGGQIQRVMIAMALVCSPELIIADEPTTALDVTIQQKILQLLADISKDLGISILFISHDLGVIRQIAERIYVMYKGIICESGLTEEVLSAPKHLYTQSLIACKPPLKSKPSRLPVISDFVHISHQGDTYNFNEVPANERYLINDDVTAQLDENLLEIKHLTVLYPTSKNFWGTPTDYLYAVNDVSFSVHRGETVGIVGESGCGKSTLGRTIVGLEQPYSGSMLLEDRDLIQWRSESSKSIHKRIQIIFQDPYSSLNPNMRIGEAIMEPMIVHNLYPGKGSRRQRMEYLLEQTGLERDWANRYPHEFSGGQRQRISIARALALEPDLIICDESVSALDVSVQAQILNLLKDLQARLGLTYIFISHDLSVVNFISHRILVMNKGSIVEQGLADHIYNHPSEEYTQKLISAIPVWN